MQNELLQIFINSKIDFSKTIVDISGGSGGLDYFDIRPKDFISYAKEDFKSNKNSGLINSITNAKRAIDCQIDTVLKTFGIAFDNLPNASNIFLKNVNTEKKYLPQKLRLIESLKIAPGGLISRARMLRNKLEHYYEIPTKEEIEEAIEIAELFILSCESKTKLIQDEYEISNKNYERDFENIKADPAFNKYSNFLRFGYDYSNKNFLILSYIDVKPFKNMSIDSQMPEYYFLLRMLNSVDYILDFKESFCYLLNFIGHPLPTKNINVVDMNN